MEAQERSRREFLFETLAGVSGAWLAANALGIIRRELALSPAALASERSRLERMLGETGDLETLLTEVDGSAMRCYDPASGQRSWISVADIREARLRGLGFPRPFAFVLPAG